MSILIDLTHTLTDQSCAWRGGCGYHPETKLDYDRSKPLSFKVNQIKMHAGIGTHIDMPAHCHPEGRTLEQVRLEEMLCPLSIIDLSDQCSPDLLVEAQHLRAYEDQYGPIIEHSLVIIATGWEKYWHSPEQYHNHYQFPHCAPSIAEFLLQRNVTGLGIDTLSPDRPDSGFPTHQTLLHADKLIIENVANASLMPAHGAKVIIAPSKLQGLTEGPVRLLGIKNT